MRLAFGLLASLALLVAGWPGAVRASGLCDVAYFLPVAEGASWTFSREARPRTVQNVQSDGFEVHSAYSTTYQGQADVIDHLDAYHCGPEGLSLVQHSEIDEAAQGSLFGGLYQGVALPRTIGSGSTWEYSYVTAGGDPSQPPVAGEFRDRVTEHFSVLGPGTLTLASGKQIDVLRVQHSIKAIGVTEGVGESDDFSTDGVDFLAKGIGWVSPDLLAYTAGSQSFDQCPEQASADAALHASEDNLVDQPGSPANVVRARASVPSFEDAPVDQPVRGSAAELVIAQALLGSGAVVNAFADLGLRADQVSVDARGGLQRFVIRLDTSGQPLLSLAAIDQLTASACVQPGSLQGAATLLVGAVQQNGDQIRVTARTVDVGTSQIQASNLADGQA
ncbi:MAG: hypothetical protein M3069_03525, partial [Chloroflexota bacterium]|nr:hypothetical protein [Chloroflexota bacterium]